MAVAVVLSAAVAVAVAAAAAVAAAVAVDFIAFGASIHTLREIKWSSLCWIFFQLKVTEQNVALSLSFVFHA